MKKQKCGGVVVSKTLAYSATRLKKMLKKRRRAGRTLYAKLYVGSVLFGSILYWCIVRLAGSSIRGLGSASQVYAHIVTIVSFHFATCVQMHRIRIVPQYGGTYSVLSKLTYTFFITLHNLRIRTNLEGARIIWDKGFLFLGGNYRLTLGDEINARDHNTWRKE